MTRSATTHPAFTPRRRGLTLLEVVTALAIFLVGVTALLQLIQNASYRAIWVDWKARASLRCQSKLAELIVGWEEPQSTEFSPFPDDAGWQWRAIVTEQFEGLYEVAVEVRRELPTGDIVRADLTQMLVPPTMRGSSLDVFAGPVTREPGSSGMKEGANEPAPEAAEEEGAAAAPAPAPAEPKGGGKR